MKHALKRLLIGVAASAMMAGAVSADTIIIGHFGNPTPMQLLSASDALKTATGWDVEWRKFDAGTDVIAAMASGDVVLSELGSSPLSIAASSGVDLQLIAYSDVIGEAESLIAHTGSGIASVADLKGKRIGVPLGSTAHFSLMGALQHEGVAESDVTIIGMKPDQIAASWDQDAIDAAWIWQPVQSELMKSGTLVLGADKVAAWGFPTFDGWVVDRAFGQAHKAEVVAFLKEIDKVNMAYLANPDAWTADSAEVKAIAAATGADPAQVPGILKGFTFLPMADQITATWLGGAVPTVKSTAEFLKAAGRIDTVVDDYSGFVNAEFATEAAK